MKWKLEIYGDYMRVCIDHGGDVAYPAPSWATLEEPYDSQMILTVRCWSKNFQNPLIF